MTDFLVRHFVRGWSDLNDLSVRESYGTLSGIVGIVVNLLLCAGKFCAGFLTGAISIMADAFNNLSDAGSSVVTLVGFRMAGQRADREHPFGHGRMEYLSGLAVSVVILLVGLELGKTSVMKIIAPERVSFSLVSVGILCASILAKLWLFVFNRTLSRRLKSAAMAATAADSITDVAATAAVLAGLLVFRFTGVSIDGWVGVLVALFVLKSGWDAAKDTIDPLLGKAPDPALVDNIRKTVLAHREVGGIHDMVIHDYGPGHTMATLHAEVSVDADISAIHDVIDNIERELGQKYRVMATIHMDPVVTQDARVLALRNKMGAAARKVDPKATIHDFRMTHGPTHTNLIFDVVVSPECPLSDEAVSREISLLAKEEDPTWRTVVQIDHDYVK